MKKQKFKLLVLYKGEKRYKLYARYATEGDAYAQAHIMLDVENKIENYDVVEIID